MWHQKGVRSMVRRIGLTLFAILVITCVAAFLVRADASFSESRAGKRFPPIELTGDVPVCNTYEQFEAYVYAVYAVGTRSSAILLVNGKFGEDACSVIKAENLLAIEVIRPVDRDTAVVRGTMKFHTDADKYFFFTSPNMFKRRWGAD